MEQRPSGLLVPNSGDMLFLPRGVADELAAERSTPVDSTPNRATRRMAKKAVRAANRFRAKKGRS